MDAFNPAISKLMRHYGFFETNSGGCTFLYRTTMETAVNTQIDISKGDHDGCDGPPLNLTDPVVVEIDTCACQTHGVPYWAEPIMILYFNSLQDFLNRLEYLPLWDPDAKNRPPKPCVEEIGTTFEAKTNIHITSYGLVLNDELVYIYDGVIGCGTFNDATFWLTPDEATHTKRQHPQLKDAKLAKVDVLITIIQP